MTSTTQPPAPVSGSITIVLDRGGGAVYRFVATPFAYQERTTTGVLTGLPVTIPPRTAYGWRVDGTCNGASLPLVHTTHDANPMVAIRTWYARIIAGGA